jgi:hypothetical protein
VSPQELASLLDCNRFGRRSRRFSSRGYNTSARRTSPAAALADVSQQFSAPTLLFCERGVRDLHLKPTGTQGKPMHCSIVRCCGRVFGEVGDALHVALRRRAVVLHHPDCVRDYVPAEVVANVIAHAVAAAAAGGGGRLRTYDVSVDEPVSQLTFYRMVQAAANKARCARPAADPRAAAFDIGFGRSVLGRVCAVLYMIALALGAEVTASGDYCAR